MHLQGIDCLKILLCYLVILGHLFQMANIQQTSGGGYFIYSFHMPLFCCISGYFFYGKQYVFKDYLINKFRQLIIPCLTWGAILACYDYFIAGRSVIALIKDYILFDLWYLKSLFCILIICFPLLQIRKKYLVLLYVLFLVIAGIGFGGVLLLALQIPAFLFGYFFHGYEIYSKNYSKKAKIFFLILSFSIFFVELLVVHPSINVNQLNMLRTFLSITDYYNYMHRVILALSGSFFLFVLFKDFVGNYLNSDTIVDMGRYTLGIYIVQSIIVERLSLTVIESICVFYYIPYAICALLLCYMTCKLICISNKLNWTIGL